MVRNNSNVTVLHTFEIADFDQLALDQLAVELGNLRPYGEDPGIGNVEIAIDLSGKKLAEVPIQVLEINEIPELKAGEIQFTQLNLSNNELTKIPPEIGQLTGLRQLNLSSNQLAKLPPEITQLQRLDILDLSDNQFSELPPEIIKMQNLTSLGLSGNQLSELPPEIAQLQNLEVLHLSSNELSELPFEIAQLQHLERLSLSNNPDIPIRNDMLEVLYRNPAFLIQYYFEVKEDSESQVRRSIEFPPELKEAGVSVLSYFSRILSKKYPDMDVGVTIEQKDTTVTLIIDTPDGQKETIERELAEYGLVVTGQKAPEEYLDDSIEVLRLQYKLDMANMEIRHTKELLYTERERYESRISNLEEQHHKMLTHILDQNSYVTMNFVASLGKLTSEASEANKLSLEAIMSIIERGVTESDRDTLATEFESIKNSNPSLFQRVTELVATGGIQGAAGNILFEVLKTFVQSIR